MCRICLGKNRLLFQPGLCYHQEVVFCREKALAGPCFSFPIIIRYGGRGAKLGKCHSGGSPKRREAVPAFPTSWLYLLEMSQGEVKETVPNHTKCLNCWFLSWAGLAWPGGEGVAEGPKGFFSNPLPFLRSLIRRTTSYKGDQIKCKRLS